MTQEISTVIVFIPFVIMGGGAAVLVLFWIYDHIRPIIDNFEASGSGSAWRGVRLWFRSCFRRLSDRTHDQDEDDDDLDAAASALLSMLPNASVVVDKSDEVVRASPAAYTLGVVDEEKVLDGDVMAAIRQVRESGGSTNLDITTSTPERFASADEPGGHGDSGIAVCGVVRPNWLKITVGRVDERFVVVLIDDVSDAIRFAQVRDSFITNVSQQLLKPSEALERLADSLQEDELDADQISWNAGNVRAACTRLNRMVSDLLLLIEAQEPITPSSANRLDVMKELSAVCEDQQADAKRLGVTLTVSGDDSLVVNGEERQIRAAVSKLVGNALVYSNRGGTVNVTAAKSSDGTQALIRVVDQGVGIVKNEQNRIFERFYRGSNQTPQSHDGIGLGLAIVKHVALTHHGGVTVWSSPGNGATFSLALPLAA